MIHIILECFSHFQHVVFKTVIHRHTVNPQFDQNFVFQNLTPDCLEKKSIVYVALFVCVYVCVRGVRISVQIRVCVGDGMHNVIALILALDKLFLLAIIIQQE